MQVTATFQVNLG